MVERPLKRHRYYVEVTLNIKEENHQLPVSGRRTVTDRCIMDVDMFMADWAVLPYTRGKYYRYQQVPPTLAAVTGRVPKMYGITGLKYGQTMWQPKGKPVRLVVKAETYKVLLAA